MYPVSLKSAVDNIESEWDPGLTHRYETALAFHVRL